MFKIRVRNLCWFHVRLEYSVTWKAILSGTEISVGVVMKRRT